MTVSVAAWWSVAGCTAASSAEGAFQADFQCRPRSVTETLGDRYIVHGCGRRAVYVCMGDLCALQSVSQREAPPRASELPARRTTAQATGTREPRSMTTDGKMMLELALEGAMLRLNATPADHADVVQLKLVRSTDAEDPDECNVAWMLNGQVVRTPKAVGARAGRELSHRTLIGLDLVSEFAAAEKVSLRVCNERFSLDREQVGLLRAFMERFQEEVAWQAKPREGRTAGMLPPAGGWPEWSVLGQPPTAIEGPALDGSTLFKKLKPSVFQVEATIAQGTSQGSAVAVGPGELLTNCHVVRGAQKILIRQDKAQHEAVVLRGDPATDRCVLAVTGVTLQPVVGVRSSASLEVGEPAYTLGSPVGLQLTLGNGIVSGQRVEEGRRLVQTTAPISPGSSGGGLFDARGNLVGITTLVLAGRERLNQALNFAIPADEFWQP